MLVSLGDRRKAPAEPGSLGTKMITDRVDEFVDEGLGNSSYLVDCGTGVAIVIDPVRDIAPYVEAARRRGVQIAFALETHLHADFISGATAFATRGVKILAPSGANLEFDHRSLTPSESLDIGDLTITAISTPGHTPEHVSYLLLEQGEPLALFSGGALLPGTVARTDLIAPDQTEPLARALHRSLNASIAPLPGHVRVYPTHGGGSFCSAASGSDRTTTIGNERRSNPAFGRDEDSFVKDLLAGYGSYPPYFLRLRDINRRGARVYEEPPALDRLSTDSVRKLVAQGAELIDVRAVREWASAHVPGSLSIELRPAFASWLGWLVDIETPLVFVLGGDQDRSWLVRDCLKIGFETLAGELDGGIDAWRAAGLPVETTATVRAGDLHGTVLDVRQDSEYAEGHVPGALHVELGSLGQASTHVPSGDVVVMCGHGQRAATAASVLLRAGHERVCVMIGGPSEWRKATNGTLESRR